jgi:hypothetical protein
VTAKRPTRRPGSCRDQDDRAAVGVAATGDRESHEIHDQPQPLHLDVSRRSV